MTPQEESFLEDVAAPSFVEGVDRGLWAIVPAPGITWPNALIRLSAAPRPNSPNEFHLLFELTGYPSNAPTATFWDVAQNVRLAEAKWPKGDADVGMVFRFKWREGVTGLYAPWDRAGLESHPDWRQSHKGRAWVPEYTVVHYLRFTRELLVSDNFRGC